MDNDQPKEPPRTRAADFRDVYTNGVYVVPGPFDFTVVVTQSDYDPATKQLKVEDKVALRMSPQHFKSMTGVFLELLVKYEVPAGSIKVNDRSPERIELLNEIIASDLVKRIREEAQAQLNEISNAPPPPEKPGRGARKKKAH